MKAYRRHFRFLLTLCFNIGLFYLLYAWLQKNIHLHSLIHNIKQTNFFSILFIFFFYFLLLLIYGWRLSLLLKTDFRKSFYIIGIGNGLNNLLPFRLGDVVRIYYAKKYYEIDIPRSTAATFIERYFDLIMLLIFGMLIILNRRYGLEVNAFYLFFILLGCGLLSMVLYRYLIVKEGFLKRWLSGFVRIQLLLSAIAEIMVTRNKGRVFVSSILIWLFIAIGYYAFFAWNLPQSSFDAGSAIFLLFTTTLAFAVPYAFAGVGLFEAAIVYYLITYLHVLPTQALALALVFHFAAAVPPLALLLMVLLFSRTRWLFSAKKLST